MEKTKIKSIFGDVIVYSNESSRVRRAHSPVKVKREHPWKTPRVRQDKVVKRRAKR